MSDLEEISDEEIHHVETAPSTDITIEDSDDDSSDESILEIRRKNKKPTVVSDSDDDDSNNDGGKNDTLQSDGNNETDDEDDDEFEERAFSPRTRMSITGIRPADFSDDSEIDYSDDEAVPKRSLKYGNNSKQNSSTEQEYESAESVMVEPDVAALVEESNDEVSLDSSLESLKEASLVESKPASKFNSPAPPRYTAVFESAVKDKLSSTFNQTHERTEIESTDESSDVQIISTKPEVVDIVSSDDDEIPLKPMPLTAPKPLVQPKITTATLNIPRSIKKTPSKKMLPKQYVSLEFYNKEEKKYQELKLDLLNAKKLKEKVSSTLPDGGRQLALRIDRLSADVEIKKNYFDSLVVEDGKAPLGQKQLFQQRQEETKSTGAPDWEALSAAVNQIQPTHTGKQGLATFNNQKALTVERLKDLHGSLESCPDENVLADDPKGLKVTLMDHQKHALAWMNWREKQKPRGGILADDMGLGKTLSMISLVLADKNRQDTEETEDNSSEESDSEGTEENRGWTSKGRRRDYYQGNTLVVCPASLLRQWEYEVQSKLSRHKLTICVHHGATRDTKPKHLRTYDIVVTTYAIVTRENNNNSALFGIKWRRIILDEAHVIRNHKAKLSEAVCALRGKYRWALTGTPVQNKAMDVYALLKFLRCTPFDDLAHWKRWIDKSAGGQQRLSTVMNTLLLRRTKVQLQEKGTLDCLPEKQIHLIEIQLDKDEMNVYQKIMIYSRTLFAQFLFQRAERNSDLMYSEEAKRPTFMQTKDPNGAYYKMHQKFTKLHQGTRDVQSHEILVLLLRLRQICCHPGLIDSMLEDADVTGSVDSESDTTQPEFDILEQLNKLTIKDTSNSIEEEDVLLPEDQVLAKASAKVLQRNNPVFDLKRPSSKMNKVLATLKEKVLNTQDKAIIVSQWTSVLNILNDHLGSQGIKTLSLNGTVPVNNRQAIVNEFNDMNSKSKVLLLSLTAGGVGLNLVGANHLLLIDLHWNPQLEAQAQDRIYRVGQKKFVNIYKFMCKETVEERIKALQDQKLAIANGILTGVKAEGSKLSMDDLRGLFDL